MNSPSTVFAPDEIRPATLDELASGRRLQRSLIAWLVFAGVMGWLASLSLAEMNISMRVPVPARTSTEPAALRPAGSAIVGVVQANDKTRMRAGATLRVIRSPERAENPARSRALQAEHADVIADLQTLTTGFDLSSAIQAGERELTGESTGPLPSPSPHRVGPVVKTLFRTAGWSCEYPRFFAHWHSGQLAAIGSRG